MDKPRPNCRLNKQQDFALCKWLASREMQPGETIADLHELARSELKIPGLTTDHVRYRVSELELQLIPAAPSTKDGKTLARIEAALRILAQEQVRILRDLGQEPSVELLGLIE